MSVKWISDKFNELCVDLSQRKKKTNKLTDKWDHKQMTSLVCYTVDTKKVYSRWVPSIEVVVY